MFKIITKPAPGIVYPNSQREKRFLRFDEVDRYSNGTLKLIVLQLKKRLEMINKEPNRAVQIERFTIDKALEVIEYRLDYRKTVRRCETVFGLRKLAYFGRKRTSLQRGRMLASILYCNQVQGANCNSLIVAFFICNFVFLV